MDPVEKIRRCREYALKFVDIQREEFKRLGIFGDWENPYMTMAPAYEAVIAREFGRLVGKGVVYKGLKPVHWCMHCKTALAQAEVEYEQERTPSVYVRFPLVAPLPTLPSAPKPSLVIWTTTPWTLPANLAIAVHPEEDYVALEGQGETLVVAAKLADAFATLAGLRQPRRFATIPGQWFAALDRQNLRERTLEAIRRQVQWIPPWGEERIFNMVAHRPDWTLSRQRVWGVPIVAFYCQGCGELLLDEGVIEHVAGLFGEGRGIEEWYLRSETELLPASTRCARCGGQRFRKETDILDVWFDSGCSHAAVLEARPELHWPAELYVEGSDQHRGWFHSSLLESMATRGRPPYRTVLTHGFFIDVEG